MALLFRLKVNKLWLKLRPVNLLLMPNRHCRLRRLSCSSLVSLAAVSLLLAGMSFIIQKAFDQVLEGWSNNVQFVVFMKPDAAADQIAAVQAALDEQIAAGVVKAAPFSDKATSFDEFQRAERRLEMPFFTTIYADRAGHIMHLFGGVAKLPLHINVRLQP